MAQKKKSPMVRPGARLQIKDLEIKSKILHEILQVIEAGGVLAQSAGYSRSQLGGSQQNGYSKA